MPPRQPCPSACRVGVPAVRLSPRCNLLRLLRLPLPPIHPVISPSFPAAQLPLLQDPEAAARRVLDVARRRLAATEGNHVAAGGDAAEVDAAFDTFEPPIR